MVNLHYTMYGVVKRAARALGWRLRRTDLAQAHHVPPTLNQALDNYQYNGSFYPIDKPWMRGKAKNDEGEHHATSDDFDVIWIDTAVTPEFVARLKPYQRVS